VAAAGYRSSKSRLQRHASVPHPLLAAFKIRFST
jgi:hypothetical protein